MTKNTILQVIASLGFASLLITTAFAQDTYTWQGVGDNNDNANNVWDTTTNWDLLAAPGSAQEGALDDIVLIPNGRATGNQRMRLRTNAGTIGSLRIGGSDGGGSTGRTELQVRTNNANLVVTGDVQIGANTGGNREGRLVMNNGNSTVEIQGDINSGSNNAGNEIFLQTGTSGSLQIDGDIDGADTDGIHEIGLRFHRANLIFGGAGAQTWNVDEFDFVETGLNFGGNTFTIPDNKTINTSTNNDGDLSRISNGNNRTYNSTLTVLGALNYGRDVRVGDVLSTNGNAGASATGNLVVGNASDGGTLTIGRELRMAISTGVHASGGSLTVNHPDSVVTIDNGIEIGSTGGTGAHTGTVTINNGTVTHGDEFETLGNATSTFNLYGGTFLTEDPGVRNVGTIDWTGGTYQVAPGTIFTATDINLGSGGTLDLLAPGGTVGDQGGDTIWDGATAAWLNSDGTNWLTNVPPDGTIAASTTIVVMQADNAITGTAPAGSGTWTPAINGTDLEATTSAAVTADPLRAVIDAGTVTRSTDLTLGAAPGNDAAALRLEGGTLDMTTSDINHGRTGGDTVVDLVGGILNVDNYYYQDNGGTVNLDGSAVLNVSGDIVEGAGGVPDTDVANAQLYVDNANLTVGGDITTQSFRVGESAGTTGTYTVPSGQTLTNTGTLYIGNAGIGNLTVAAGGTVNAGPFLQEESTAGPGGSLLTVNGDWTSSGTSDVGRRDSGTITVNTGGTFTHTGTLRFANDDFNAHTATMNVAGGTVTVNGNLFKGNNGNRNATMNVSAGQLSLGGDLDWDANGNGFLNVTGGRVDFLSDSGANLRRVRNLTLDGAGAPTLAFTIPADGTIEPLHSISAPTITAGTLLALDSLGGSETPGGGAGNIDDTTVWVGGNAAWDAVAANWDAFDESMASVGNVLPASAADVSAAGNLSFDLISAEAGTLSPTDFTAADPATWTVVQGTTTGDIALENAASTGTGPAVANILDGSDVTRAGVLRIGLDSNADASLLNLSGGSSLTLGASDDIIVGGGGLGVINQGIIGGTTADVTARNLLFGGAPGTDGGTYNLNAGTLTLTGTIREGSADTVSTNVDTARVNVNGGTLSVSGTDIDLQDLSIGDEDGSNGTWATTTGQDINITGRLTVGRGTDGGSGATGSFTVGAGSTVTANNLRAGQNGSSTGTLTVAGDLILNNTGYVAGEGTGDDNDDDTVATLNIIGNGTVTHNGQLEIGRVGDGFLNISDSGVLDVTTGNLVFSQNQTGDDDATATIVMTGGELRVSNANQDLNMNNGAVTFDQSGGTVDLERNFNIVNDNSQGILTFSGTSIVNVAGNMDFRGGTTGDTVTVTGFADINITGNLDINGGANDLFKIVGDDCTVDVGGILADSESAFEFEFDNSAVTPITVSGTSTLDSAVLNLTGTLPTTGSFTVIDNGTAASTGVFNINGSDVIEGGSFSLGGQNYTITYAGGGDSFDVVITAVNDSVISISALSGDVIEGTSLTFDLLAVPAGNIDVTLAYTGTATDGGTDYTEMLTITTTGANTTLTIPTAVDSELEGSESVTVTIVGTGSGGLAGSPVAATSFIFDGNLPPRTDGNETQSITYSGSGTVDIGEIMVMDDAGSISRIVSTATDPAFVYNGPTNSTTFGDGSTTAEPEDNAFTLLPDPGSPGNFFSIDLELKPSPNDVAVGNYRTIYEMGGTSNGHGIYMIDGIPHLIVKMNGGDTDQPSGRSDFDFGDGDDSISVPLTGSALAANERVHIAVIFSLTNVAYSVNGAAVSNQAISGTAGKSNWSGNDTVNIGTAGNGGLPGGSGTGDFVSSSYVALDNAPTGNAISTLRYWNQSDGTMSINAVSNPALTVSASVAFDTYVDDPTTGTISDTTALGVYSAGTWSIGPTSLANLNNALANLQFSAGSAPPNPVQLNVSIDDGGTPVTGTILIFLPTSPLYVDDAFTGDAGTTVADADDGTAGAELGTIGFNAFQTIADALAIATTNTTIIINDGTYAETPTLSDAQVLQLTGSGGSAGGSTVTIDSLSSGSGNTIALDSNDIVLGNNAGDNIIDGVISGTGSLEKVGTDRLVLRNDNTYTGTTTITEGFLRLGFVGAQRGTLQSSEIITTAPGILELNVQVDTTYTHSILISGTGEVRTLDNGTVEFDGPANTFTGEFHLGDGTSSFFNGIDGAKEGFVVVNNNDHLGAGTIRSRGGQLQAGTASLDIPNPVLVEGGGLRMGGTIDFELSGAIEVIGATRGFSNLGLDGLDITLSGDIDLAEGTNSRSINFEGAGDKDNGNFIVTGNISGTAGSSIQLQNSLDEAILTISGTNTYPGSTTLSNGAPESTIVFNGSHTGAGDYNIDGGTLEGTGTTDGNVNIDGDATVSPGNGGPGTLTTGNLDIEGTFVGDIDGTGTVAGTDFDQIVVTGTVDVDGATFDLSSSVVLSAGTYVLVANDAADATTGTPVLATGVGAGLLPGGSTGVLEIGGLTTTGGDGNDVAIGLSEIPADDDTGDSDGLGALLELAFGTDYLVNDNNPLVVVDPTTFTPGTQITDLTFGPLDFDGRFVRRVDHASIGLTYTPQFSHDMSVWVDATDTTPTVVVPDDGSGYEVVEIDYDIFIPSGPGAGQKARFFRMLVNAENSGPLEP